MIPNGNSGFLTSSGKRAVLQHQIAQAESMGYFASHDGEASSRGTEDVYVDAATVASIRQRLDAGVYQRPKTNVRDISTAEKRFWECANRMPETGADSVTFRVVSTSNTRLGREARVRVPRSDVNATEQGALPEFFQGMNIRTILKGRNRNAQARSGAQQHRQSTSDQDGEEEDEEEDEDDEDDASGQGMGDGELLGYNLRVVDVYWGAHEYLVANGIGMHGGGGVRGSCEPSNVRKRSRASTQCYVACIVDPQHA